MTPSAALSLADLASDRERESYDAKTVPIWQVKPWTPEATHGIGPKRNGAEPTRCALWGCERPVFAHGLCGADFKFWKRNGTEALNRRRKRIPETREEARALLQVRAIEFADAEYGTAEFDRALRDLEEAGRLFGDPVYREKYNKKRDALRARHRRESQDKVKEPFKGKDGLTTKERIIAEQGIEAWRAYRRGVDERLKARFIAKHGEAAWRARQAKYATAYYHRQKAKKREAAQQGEQV